ncbi:MAG: peptidoglycan DD-metalloendopeptidase family protein [Bacteroidota bacterium]
MSLAAMSGFQVKKMSGWIGLLLIGSLLMAQSISDKTSSKKKPSLGKERNKLERQINLSNQLLQETSSQKAKSLNQLVLMNRQIKLRQELVDNLNKDLEQTTQEIDELNNIICSMQEDIENLRVQYAHTAQVTYRSFNENNFWLSILSASTVSEAYYRSLYFRQFSRFRRTQIDLLTESSSFLLQKSDQLNENIAERSRLLDDKAEELQLLQTNRNQQQSLYTELEQDEAEFRRKLKQQQLELNKVIVKIERQQAQKEKKKRHTATASVNNVPAPAAEKATKVDANFTRQKGYLPWPVASNRSFVVGEYGESQDPYGNRIVNNGVFIQTPKGERVRAIFAGKVTGVQRVPLSGTMVIVQHGPYRTVYANLEEVKVATGDEISVKQELGVVRLDDRTGESVLNFLVYKVPNTFEDPLKWVIKTQ